MSRENRSKPPMSMLGPLCFLSSGFGPDKTIFSRCWCCERTANLLTWTGMGTTILLPGFPVVGFLGIPWEDIPAFTRFHFARRFWNQILTFREERDGEVLRTAFGGRWFSHSHLNFTQFKSGCDLTALGQAEVLLGMKLPFQFQELLRGKGSLGSEGEI